MVNGIWVELECANYVLKKGVFPSLPFSPFLLARMQTWQLKEALFYHEVSFRRAAGHDKSAREKEPILFKPLLFKVFCPSQPNLILTHHRCSSLDYTNTSFQWTKVLRQSYFRFTFIKSRETLIDGTQIWI